VFFLVFGAEPRHYFLNFDDEDAAVAPAARSEENEQIAPAGRDESEGERRPLSLSLSCLRSLARRLRSRVYLCAAKEVEYLPWGWKQPLL